MKMRGEVEEGGAPGELGLYLGTRLVLPSTSTIVAAAIGTSGWQVEKVTLYC